VRLAVIDLKLAAVRAAMALEVAEAAARAGVAQIGVEQAAELAAQIRAAVAKLLALGLVL
jgi:hypothetical protein